MFHTVSHISVYLSEVARGVHLVGPGKYLVFDFLSGPALCAAEVSGPRGDALSSATLSGRFICYFLFLHLYTLFRFGTHPPEALLSLGSGTTKVGTGQC